MRPALLAIALSFAICAPALAQDVATPKYRSAKEIIDAAPASAWRDLDPANTLYMELPAGRVIIELAPGFAPAHVANIKTMAKGGFWDGLTIYRSQDNFVVQFGDADGDDKAKARPFPAGTRDHLPAEFTRSAEGVRFDKLPDVDGWAPQVGFADGMPAARDPKAGKLWMTHCYGVLGAGRSNPPDSSIGAELYGHAEQFSIWPCRRTDRARPGRLYASRRYRSSRGRTQGDREGQLPVVTDYPAFDAICIYARSCQPGR